MKEGEDSIYSEEYKAQKRNRTKITNLTETAKKKQQITINDKIECPNCHRAIMEPYTQPTSGHFDNHGKEIDSLNITGFKTGSKWLKCPLLQCNHRIEIPSSKRKSKVELAHGEAEGGIGKLFVRTLGTGKKKTNIDPELAALFGGHDVTITDSREMTYDSQGGWH